MEDLNISLLRTDSFQIFSLSSNMKKKKKCIHLESWTINIIHFKIFKLALKFNYFAIFKIILYGLKAQLKQILWGSFIGVKSQGC